MSVPLRHIMAGHATFNRESRKRLRITETTKQTVSHISILSSARVIKSFRKRVSHATQTALALFLFP